MFEGPFKPSSVKWGIFWTAGMGSILVIVAWQLQNWKHGFRGKESPKW